MEDFKNLSLMESSGTETLNSIESSAETNGSFSMSHIEVLNNMVGVYNEAERIIENAENQLESARGLTNNEILDHDRAVVEYNNLEDKNRATDMLDRAREDNPHAAAIISRDSDQY